MARRQSIAELVHSGRKPKASKVRVISFASNRGVERKAMKEHLEGQALARRRTDKATPGSVWEGSRKKDSPYMFKTRQGQSNTRA